MENHFSLFRRKPLSGFIIRNFWLVGVTLLTMAYQGTLKVCKGAPVITTMFCIVG